VYVVGVRIESAKTVAASKRTEPYVTDEHNKPHDDDSDTDKMSFSLPIGGGFNVSGPNASQLWGKVGWAMIILAAGFVMERLATVFVKLTQ
jgi:hypothetical protein